MGKGKRNKTLRRESGELIRNAMDVGDLRKALNKQVNTALGEAHDRFFRNEVSVILWALHESMGFGASRLRRFYDTYEAECRKLREHYDMSEEDMPYLTTAKLKEIGVDLEEWENA